MANSINTNVGALVALRNLNIVTRDLETVQDRISTGFKVIGAKDDASNFAIAQGLRGDLRANDAVNQGLANARGVINVAIAGATELSNLLQDLKAKAIEGANPANTTSQQGILDADFTELVNQFESFISNAVFNGVNLLSSGAANVDVVSDISGGTLTITAQDMEAVQASLAATDLTSAANASGALAAINTAITTVGTALGSLGADARTIDSQSDFLVTLRDATEEGLSAIVDADMAKESAQLQALQTKQQLSVQSLSIANQAPSILLGLFGG